MRRAVPPATRDRLGRYAARMNPDAQQTMTERLLTLLRTSTEVPAGSHEIEAGDPRIIAAIDDVVLPMIEALEPDNVERHPGGDLVARFGPPGDNGLLIQTYIVSQHGNEMTDPLAGRLADGESFGVAGQVAVGQGANQNKGPMAAAFTALAMRPADLVRPVLLAVNAEGMSSHGGSRRIIDELGARAARAVLAFGTDLNVSIGNRGRRLETADASISTSRCLVPRRIRASRRSASTRFPEPPMWSLPWRRLCFPKRTLISARPR